MKVEKEGSTSLVTTNKQDLSVADALARVLTLVPRLGTEQVAILDALGSVLAQDVVARDSLPPFDNSSMDGFGLRAADISNATKDTPIQLHVVGDIAAGHWPDIAVQAGQAVRIMTGAAIPIGVDAVIPVEDTDEVWARASSERALPDAVQIYRTVKSGDYIRPKGDDCHAGATILRSGHRIRPQEISVMASLGVATVTVYRRAKVGILATGDELVPVEAELQAGQIRNSNGYAQAAQVAASGAIPISLGVARDTEADVRAKLQAGLAAGVDMFISSAGVSVGAYDVVKSVLDTDGDVDFWRVRMRPGKPLAFGTYAGIPYIGLPGNPVSSMVSFDTFARPALLQMMGRHDHARREIKVELGEDIKSDGRQSYIRAILKSAENGTVAHTTGDQGSHRITSLVNANALVIIPEGIQLVKKGAILTALLLD